MGSGRITRSYDCFILSSHVRLMSICGDHVICYSLYHEKSCGCTWSRAPVSITYFSLVTKMSVQTLQCGTLRRLIWFSKKTNLSSSSYTCYNPSTSKCTYDLEHLLKHDKEQGFRVGEPWGPIGGQPWTCHLLFLKPQLSNLQKITLLTLRACYKDEIIYAKSSVNVNLISSLSTCRNRSCSP